MNWKIKRILPALKIIKINNRKTKLKKITSNVVSSNVQSESQAQFSDGKIKDSFGRL
jgi:hypothetical protein